MSGPRMNNGEPGVRARPRQRQTPKHLHPNNAPAPLAVPTVELASFFLGQKAQKGAALPLSNDGD
jgi:hypothetical protein